MKKVLFLVLCTAGAWLTQAQTLSKTDVIKVRGSGAIVQNGMVRGYYTFYNLEKQDRKNNHFLLSVTDENLHEINSVDIVRPNTYVMIEAAFNGEAFSFLFYDMREKQLELIGYDKTLKETGTITKTLKNRWVAGVYTFIAQGHAPMQAYLVAVPNKGFIYYGIQEESKGDYEIEFYDNTMKKQWVANGNTKDEYIYENAAETFSDENYAGSMILKRKSLFSQDIEVDLLVNSVADGKQLFRVPMETSKYKLSISEVYFDKATQQFTVFAEYFNKTDEIMKALSQGFATVILDIHGKIVSEKANSWADIAKNVPAKDKEDFQDRDLMIHDFIRTNDGQIFAIAEQYKKAGNPMTGIKLNIFNMVILQFGSDYTVNKVSIFEKDKNSFSLGQGVMIFNTKMLSYIAKAYGGFDFVYTQPSPDKSTFVASYINYDRERGEKAKNVLGSIIYTPEKTFTVDKLVLNRKSSKYFVYRAKEGYVYVAEYFEKEKRMDSRLEKLNY
jgi:hypothetical protein